MPAPFEAEIAGLARTLARNPTSRIFAPLAEAYRRAGRIEEAVATCQAGLRHHPHFLSGQLVLARCWHDRGELDLASAGFREVLRGDSRNAVALRALGEIARERGEREEAAGWFRQALEADPGDEELRSRLESVASPAGDAPAATAAASPAAEIATVTLAEVYLEQGLHERALSVYRRILSADPANASVQDRVRRLELLLADERGAAAAAREFAGEAVGEPDAGSVPAPAEDVPDPSWAFLLEDEEDQDPDEVFASSATRAEPSGAPGDARAGAMTAGGEPATEDAAAPEDEDLRKFQEWLRSLR